MDRPIYKMYIANIASAVMLNLLAQKSSIKNDTSNFEMQPTSTIKFKLNLLWKAILLHIKSCRYLELLKSKLPTEEFSKPTH